MVSSDISKEKWFFFLEKQAFWDAMRIRYNIPLECLLTLFVCGDTFNLQRALSCPKGGLVIARQNELRNLQLKYKTKFAKM